MKRYIALSLALAPLVFTANTEAQAQFRLPSIKKPTIPKLPDIRPPVKSDAQMRRQSRASGNVMQDFITDTQKLSNPIDTTTVGEDDNQRIDQEVADYRALADRITDGRYNSMPAAQRDPMLSGLKVFYDGAASATDDQIEESKGMISGRGKADAAYNFLIAHDAYLYAAQKLFPRERSYAKARKKVADAINELGGSRSGALQAEDSAELAAARNVRMPAAITRDKGAEAQFRQAWKTSGIPWEIVKINVTSGWRDKVEYGRVIGQRRDAAIAARDPNNPDRCNLYDFTMFRDRSGNVRRDSHNTTRIACENIK